MSKTNSLHRVTSFVGSLLLVGLIVLGEGVSHSALAQTLPPRPTLTSEPPPDQSDDDDNEEEEPTPVATATVTPAPTFTATPVLPTPITLPVTGGAASDGIIWVMIGMGLLVSSLGTTYALQLFRKNRANSTES
ncbi:MAG: hypothetical protein R3E79_24180 [Caldilineaceae bacterium]